MEEKEIWRIYKKTRRSVWEVSNYGRVKKNGKIYQCKICISGYLQFCGGYFVHRAVAQTWIPNPEGKPCVNHKDTNKLNNHVDNLEWCTQKENCNNPLSKQHYSEGQKGNKNAYRKPKSEETKAKMSAAKKGRSWFIGPDGKRHWTDK